MNKKNEIIADLHTHSSESDGDCTPIEVVQEAYTLGLEAVALTDHDTLSGLVDALKAGNECGITVICGVEVSLRFNRTGFVGSLHYLLYFPTSLIYNHEFHKVFNATISKGRGHNLVVERVDTINKLFGPFGNIEPVLRKPLSVEEIEAEGDRITRRHFAKVLTQRHGLDNDKVNRLISNNSPAYIPSGIEMNRLKPLFERFPMIKVLAHAAAGSFPAPSIYQEMLPPLETVEKIMPEFLSLGLDGLEIYYPGHTIEHIEKLKYWAQNYHLLITGGSDFHDRINRPLGKAGVCRSDLDALLALL